MIKKIILSFGLLLIVGCGAQSNPDDAGSSTISDSATNLVSQEDNSTIADEVLEGTSTDESSIEGASREGEDSSEISPEPSLLPPKVSLDFPTLLKAQQGESNETNRSNSVDLGYLQLTRSIEKIDEVIDFVQVNLNILAYAMPDIQRRCEGMVSCVFKQNRLTVAMDNETISSINDIIIEHNRSLYDTNGSRFSLGEVGFYTYDLNESYQYMIQLNLRNGRLYRQNNKILRESQTIKWSEDNRDVVTLYDYEDNETNNSIVLHYLIDTSNKETMHVYRQDDNQKIGYQETTSLVLSKTKEQNSSESNDSTTYALTSNSILKKESNTSRFSSNIEINKEESLLLFSGAVSDENSSNELLVSSELSCDNNQTCDKNNTKEDYDGEVELYELKIVGGNLKDGEYVLLAPDTDIDSLSLMSIFENSLGNFTIYEGERQGALHSDGFLYLLNSLIIVYIYPAQESTKMFEIVPLADKPTLRIVK
jgi:hypothetical protein